jgi:hypothetical protein
MSWLRREKDWLGLILAWTLFVQAFAFGATSSLHAATLVGEAGNAPIICGSKGIGAGPQSPGHTGHGGDCPCCMATCRPACCHAATAYLPAAPSIPLPASGALKTGRLHGEALSSSTATLLEARPRAPPAA